MDHANVIIRPLVTEKGTHLQATRNTYSFQVDHRANKQQIRLAVEKLYDVKVIDVRTLNRKGKPRRTRKGETKGPSMKKAIVVLDEASRIEVF